MDINFEEDVKFKSSEELRKIAINFNMYPEALVLASKAELVIRGIEISNEELRQIVDLNKNQKYSSILAKDSYKSWNFIYGKWNLNIVDDNNAPQLYSRQVIVILSCLFSVFFGGILLAINIRSVNNKKSIFPVLIYSFVYTGLLAFILKLLPGSNIALSVYLNLLGSMILSNFFWRKYIGKEFQYRTKSFRKPLITGTAISIIFILVIFAGRKILSTNI
jgi:hypothetical protein